MEQLTNGKRKHTQSSAYNFVQNRQNDLKTETFEALGEDILFDKILSLNLTTLC